MATKEKTSKTQKLQAKILQKTEFLRNKPSNDTGILLDIPFVPVSVNDLYYNNPRGGRALSKEGRVYKLKVIEYINTNYLDQIQLINPNSVFAVHMNICLTKDDLITKSYLEDPNTQSPFKRRDVGNMEKILIDCIKEILMKDDSQIFEERIIKSIGPIRRVVIGLSPMDPMVYISRNIDEKNKLDILYKIAKYEQLGEPQ